MKRTTIVTSLLLASVLLTFNACKKGADSVTPGTPENKVVGAVTVENGRLAFNTHKDYYNYIDAVKPEASTKSGFRSLYTALYAGYKKKDSDPGLSPMLKDLDQFGFPSGFQATLNEKGEVKIGNEIVWYHNGNKYFIPASEEANLEMIKQKPELIKKAHPYITKNLQSANARVDLGNTGLDARHQYVFFPVDAAGNNLVGSNRKYVHEIYGKYDYIGEDGGVNIYRAHVILRLKMEWRGCCDWNPNASEERSESVAVNGNAALPGMSRWSTWITGPNFNINQSIPSTHANIDITLVTAEVVGPVPSTWNIEINGTITSAFTGATDASGRWNNVGAPLW
jgi:hypothetical protein